MKAWISWIFLDCQNVVTWAKISHIHGIYRMFLWPKCNSLIMLNVMGLAMKLNTSKLSVNLILISLNLVLLGQNSGTCALQTYAYVEVDKVLWTYQDNWDALFIVSRAPQVHTSCCWITVKEMKKRWWSWALGCNLELGLCCKLSRLTPVWNKCILISQLSLDLASFNPSLSRWLSAFVRKSSGAVHNKMGKATLGTRWRMRSFSTISSE